MLTGQRKQELWDMMRVFFLVNEAKGVGLEINTYRPSCVPAHGQETGYRYSLFSDRVNEDRFLHRWMKKGADCRRLLWNVNVKTDGLQSETPPL